MIERYWGEVEVEEEDDGGGKWRGRKELEIVMVIVRAADKERKFENQIIISDLIGEGERDGPRTQKGVAVDTSRANPQRADLQRPYRVSDNR
jgi:hypothetical protein